MVKSSSVGAPEPEKLQKNKVGPIIWDTLYLDIMRYGSVKLGHQHKDNNQQVALRIFAN